MFLGGLEITVFLSMTCAGGTEEGAQEAIPEYSAAEERRDSALWRNVAIGEQEHRVDMKCIEPYRKVVSHGGTRTHAHARTHAHTHTDSHSNQA